MSDTFFKNTIRKNLQGKQLSGDIKEKLAKELNLKQLNQGEAKKQTANIFAGKSTNFANDKLRKMGVNPEGRRKLIGVISGSKFGNSGLTEAQKKRNIQQTRFLENKNTSINRGLADPGRLGTKTGNLGLGPAVKPSANMTPKISSGIKPIGF